MTRPRSLAILAAAVLAASASAQPTASLAGPEEPIPPAPSTGHRRAATIEAVRLGWRGHLLSDCWSPARIYISGNPQRDNGAFGGTLELVYAQDGSQSAQISVPIATTPGRVTPVEVAVAFPQNASRLAITLYDEAGRAVDFRQYGRGVDDLPATILHATPIVLAVADRTGISPSVTKAFDAPGLRAIGVGTTTNNFGQPSPARNPLDDMASITVAGDDLPESWAAYDGVTAVVIGADEIGALSQARLAALRQWLHAGGCVITRVGIANGGLNKLFEETPWRVEVLEQKTLTPGSELQRVFAEPAPVEKEGKIVEARASLHESLAARALALGTASDSPDPDAAVWRVRWSPSNSTRVNGFDTEGLLAEGPAGFGWVVVLATDPAMLGTGSSDAAARVAWRDVMRPVCSELATRARDAQEYVWGERGSGPDRAARIALRSTLNHLSSVPALGDGTFIVIGLCLLALAAAVGPFDAIFLGAKKKRQISWATAMLWIGAASIIAAAAPPLIRSGESKVQRLRVVDALTTPASGIAHQTGITTIFAGSGGTIAIAAGDGTTLDALWFRGISPLFVAPSSGTDPISRFATAQRGSASDLGRGRSNQLDQASPMRMGQWTFRTFMEQGPIAAAPLPLRVKRDGAQWSIRGVSVPGTLVEASLRVGQSWLALTQLPDGTLHAPGDTTAGKWQCRNALNQADHFRDLDFESGMALELPGVRERSRTIDARLASGRWGVLYLHAKDAPPTLRCSRLTWTGGGEPYACSEETVYRVLFPLEDAAVDRTTWSVSLPKSMTTTQTPGRQTQPDAPPAPPLPAVPKATTTDTPSPAPELHP